MTTGSFNNSTEIHPYTRWRVGGYGTPQALDTKSWTGGDGHNSVNHYEMTRVKAYQGYLYAAKPDAYWGDCRNAAQPVCYAYNTPVFNSGFSGIAATNAAEKLIGIILRHDFQLNITVAEGKETVQYLYKRLKPIYTMLKYLKRGDFRRAYRAVVPGSRGKRVPLKRGRASARYYLEIRYAITPLIYDINNAIEKLDAMAGPPQSGKVFAKSGYKPIWSASSGVGGYRNHWANGEYFEYAHVGVTLKENFDYEAVDLANPATPLWELAFLSFVLDWAIPIGNFLRARYFFRFSEYSDGFMTQLKKMQVSNLVYRPSGYTCNVDASEASAAFYEKVSMQRSPWTGGLKFPSFTNPIAKVSHWKRAADVVALIEVLSSGGRRPRLIT